MSTTQWTNAADGTNVTGSVPTSEACAGASSGQGQWCCAGACGTCAIALATGQTGADTISVDATNVYWGITGAVMMVPKAGGTPTTLAGSTTSAGVQTSVGGIALNSMTPPTVYWTNQVSGGSVVSMVIGGTATTIVSGACSGAGAITIDTDNVYWGCSSSVMKAALSGANPTTLASGSGASGLVVDATDVYWTNYSGGSVMKASTGATGGAGITLQTIGNMPTGIAGDALNVYVSDGNQVLKVPKSGGSAVTLNNSAGLGPLGIAVDASGVYWANFNHTTVQSCGLVTGTPLVTLASGQSSPIWIAVDATAVYWTDTGSGGNVMKAPK
jgi:hypothetical protein